MIFSHADIQESQDDDDFMAESNSSNEDGNTSENVASKLVGAIHAK